RPALQSPHQAKGEWLPSLSLSLACRWYGVDPAQVRVERGALVLPGAAAPGETPRDLRVPVDAGGRLLIRYARKGLIASRFLSAWQLREGLRSGDPRQLPRLEHRAALIYLAHSGSGDL